MGFIFLFFELFTFVVVLGFIGIASFSTAILVFLFSSFFVSKVLLQVSCVLFFALLYTFLGYKKIKKVLGKKKSPEYNDLIGGVAYVINENLKIGHIGCVKWSGTICKATTHEKEIEIGQQVKIINIENNILHVKKY